MKPLQRAAHHFQRGEYDLVAPFCGEVIAADPADARAWQLRGLAALHLERFEDAARDLEQAAMLRPSAPAFVNFAAALLALGRDSDAATALERALEIDPENAGAYFSLSACYFRQFRYQEADDALERALAINPGWPKAIDMQARVAWKRGNAERAVEMATMALATDPTLSISHRVLADIAMRNLDYDLAQEHYQSSLRNAPDDAETHGNYALLLTRRGEYERAVPWYARAVEVLRNDPPLQQGFADVLLAMGRFSEGWSRYSWRHFLKDENLPLVDQPFLDRLPEGDRAVVVFDQGVGDQTLMASMLPDLMRHYRHLEVQCDSRLHTIFRRSFPGVQFTNYVLKSAAGATATPGSFGMADAGRWLRTSFESFPRHSGYLKPDEALRRELRVRYASKSGPVVGISWATKKAIKFAPHKTVPLNTWGPILSMPGITFVSLQYDSDPAEIADAVRTFGAKIISDPTIDPNGDLDAFAAQVSAMDLVITTSSAAAHIAGALNVPTWVLVPTGFGALWHWFLQREDSPWYPSVRLFRQPRRGEWSSILERVSSAFLDFVENWSLQKTHD
jgi:tetratricopeptide (TPR) repeat protein